ncbi:methanogenesis marker 6 protein [Methanolobus mangrovi]|uniref:Methanogenesis marker 6 protein n=1 Tax=Methanolobus mangrovi TaxID=3072977 RepID=A0AA51YIJ1_9EURY|nr:methanogenesis marker 6 protein [Methanolobus mangrovi]WMW21603.1 methanogenesis marker 6 protein [Methanolobus mangrovi]
MAEDNEDVITKLVVTGSDSVLPIDAAMQIYESNTDIVIKETCFGTMVTGPRVAVDKVVKEVVDLDKNHIFVKERGFPPGDERRCRASRGGGARPGFYFLKEESMMLPMIGKALDKYDKQVPLKETEHKKRLGVKDLQDIIESTQ